MIDKYMSAKLRAVIITAEGFEDEEVIYPVIRLAEEGYDVNVATKDKKMVKGRLDFPLELLINYYARHVDALHLSESDFDIVLVPGGFEAPDRVRQMPEVLDFIRSMYKRGKIVAAFCHGPWVLISSGILKGKQATCYQGIIDDLKNAGAIYLNQPVVKDGVIITSQHPRDVGEFMKVLIAASKEDSHANNGKKEKKV